MGCGGVYAKEGLHKFHCVMSLYEVDSRVYARFLLCLCLFCRVMSLMKRVKRVAISGKSGVGGLHTAIASVGLTWPSWRVNPEWKLPGLEQAAASC